MGVRRNFCGGQCFKLLVRKLTRVPKAADDVTLGARLVNGGGCLVRIPVVSVSGNNLFNSYKVILISLDRNKNAEKA